MPSVHDVINSDLRLPSPPAIAVRILNAVKKDDASFSELAGIISSDPALSARVLSVANSSFYALPFKVDSVEKAVSVLGVDVLKNIALSFVIVRGMKGTGGNGFDFDFFWKRSITAAVAAELVASMVKQRSDDTFVTALLQDIGVVVMSLCMANDYGRVMDEKRVSGDPIQVVERRMLGFDHQELGAEILRKWGIPSSVYLPVGCHHSPASADEGYRGQSEILMLSDKISSVYHGTRSAEKFQEIKDILAERFGAAGDDVDALIDVVAEKSSEIMSSFEIDPGEMKPFSQILQEANEELGRLNMSYEHLVMELKQAKEKAERYAGELREANERLRRLAFRDGLTGLYNHRYFQELMDRELSRAARYGRPFSLILFDIDHFKRVNDTYGHLRGDIVLRAVSATVMRLTRESDIAARYGGEEFAVILPETDLKGGAVLAERLRREIERMVIPAEGEAIRVTISLGVATYEPGMTPKEKSDIIDAADRALYNSKRTGRNRVSISGGC